MNDLLAGRHVTLPCGPVDWRPPTLSTPPPRGKYVALPRLAVIAVERTLQEEEVNTSDKSPPSPRATGGRGMASGYSAYVGEHGSPNVVGAYCGGRRRGCRREVPTLWCDVIELPCGHTLRRYSPREREIQLYRPLGEHCLACRRPERHYYTELDGRRIGPLCWGRARRIETAEPAEQTTAIPARSRRPRATVKADTAVNTPTLF